MIVTYINYAKVPSREANSVHIMKMCQAFQQEGHETTLIVPEPDERSAEESTDLWEHYGISTPFRLQRIQLAENRRASILDHTFALKAVRAAARLNAELVFTRHVYTAMYASLGGIPTIYEAHGPLITGRLGRLYLTGLFRGSGFRRLVVITDAGKKTFVGDKLPADRVVVAPDGVDMERFESLPDTDVLREELGWQSSELIACYCGHLYPGRGVELILEVARRVPTARFVIVGGRDADVAASANQACAMGLRNVEFLGFLPNSQLPRYLAAADALLMPYQRVITTPSMPDTSRWMSPMKMFEYMGAGRLIISSDLPVLREVLDDSNSVLCAPDDPSQWAAALARAGKDTDWRERTASKARRDVLQYTWRARVHRIIDDLN